MLAGIDAVDLVVGAHHRARLAAIDGDLEGQQVALAQGGLVQLGVMHEAAGFLGVEGEVLDGRDDVAALDAGHLGPDDLAGQQRILAGIFEVAAVARLAG